MSGRSALRCRKPGCRAVIGWVNGDHLEVLLDGTVVVADLTTGTAHVWCPACGTQRHFHGLRVTVREVASPDPARAVRVRARS